MFNIKIQNYNREYYLKHKEKWKEYSKKAREKLKEDNYLKVKIWKKQSKKYKINHRKDTRLHGEKYPERIKARMIANRKIKIPKGQICVKCKKSLATEKHHEDYTKPLKVKFVCVKCHRKLDKEVKKSVI